MEVLVATVSARYSAGQADQEALAKVALEKSELEERLTDLAMQRVTLVATMNRLTSQPDGTDLGYVQSLPDLTAPDDQARKIALERSPELAAARASARAADRRLDSAKLETKPNFLVGLSGGATTTGDPLITLRVGLELPLFSGQKQTPLIRAAEHDVEASRQDLRASELAVREQMTRLVAQWQRDEAQIERYRTTVVPQTNVALEAARGSYAAGRGDFSTVVEDFRRWLDARVGLARREADRFMTWSEIQALTALPPEGSR
jgi:outer membrane protein TolC